MSKIEEIISDFKSQIVWCYSSKVLNIENMKFNIYIILAWVFLLFISYFGVHAQDTPPVDLYCGDQNCYEGKRYNIK